MIKDSVSFTYRATSLAYERENHSADSPDVHHLFSMDRPSFFFQLSINKLTYQKTQDFKYDSPVQPLQNTRFLEMEN